MSGGSVYTPVVADEILWQTEMGGTAGRLVFKVFGDGTLNFFEGDKVEFYHDGAGVFSGFVFTKKRDRRNIITVTAYDQLRYLKNKDTYVYGETTAAELLKKVLADINLKAGEIEETSVKLIGLIEQEKSIIDIVMRAVKADEVYSGKKYVLYDDFGKISLKSAEKLRSEYVINGQNSGDFSYSSTIDEETYSTVKVREKGNRQEYITVKNDEAVGKWGILQKIEVAEKGESLEEKANAVLKEKAKRTRHIVIENVLGNLSVRAGSEVFVSLNLGDIIVNEFFTVQEASHKFFNGKYVMDVVLKGGEFVE